MTTSTEDRTVCAGIRDRVLTAMNHWGITRAEIERRAALSRACVANALSSARKQTRRKRATYSTMAALLDATNKIVEERRSKVARNGYHG